MYHLWLIWTNLRFEWFFDIELLFVLWDVFD